ncbi:hypothetical protein ACFUAC_12345 [Streptomyces sp. NPDC057148]|uniref:hypothetical protein n=1 Tax=unclassified Streptomyces TaxID=2593676 RepID=UPI003644F43C
MAEITNHLTEEELSELRAEARRRDVAVERLAHDVLVEGVVARRQRRNVAN